ncbi:MAG: S-layer homology domain-containing protein [Pseudanabaenaceae cyanobacterium bins.39]|nr:S-layer homology domain-containing protein [Pseudanabaenaceae cyanobacterium bins.39]
MGIGILLNACQGSLSSSIEGAIAPTNPETNNPQEATKPSPSPNAPIATPSSQPTISPSPANLPIASSRSQVNDQVNGQSNLQSKEKLKEQLEAIALPQTITNTNKSMVFNGTMPINGSPKDTKVSNFLQEWLYIDVQKLAKAASTKDFSDLNQAPAALQPWIRDLYTLGTITAKKGTQFQPNALVSRRDYAKWLLATNNRLYAKQPSRQVRLAQPTDIPKFIDIPPKDPDFAIIQGLANAGLISGDRFRPEEPLSREEMVQWKIPLDLRQPLPSANLESLEQAWGFQDSDRIAISAQSAIFADAQLRDLSNIRRSFGFTTIFQPQKPVTRAEAAASLWYFGTATDGISAQQALQVIPN